MFDGNKQKTEKLRNDLNGITMFGQIVRVKKAIGKRTFFCFNAAFVCNVRKGAK